VDAQHGTEKSRMEGMESSGALEATTKAQKSGSKEDHQAAALAHNEAAGVYEEMSRLHGYDTAEGEKAQLLSEIHASAEWAHEYASGNPDIEDKPEQSIDELVDSLHSTTALSSQDVSKKVNVGGKASKSSGKMTTSKKMSEKEKAWHKQNALKGASSRDCSVCGGTGQIKNEQKQEDCPSCGGAGKITTAEDNDGSAVMEDQIMKKVDAIKALTSCPCSGFVAADAKELEAFSEERLSALATFVVKKKKTDDEVEAEKEAAAKKLKDAEATITELKAAAAKTPTEEEYLAKAPDSIRTLVADKKAQDTKVKTDLVAQLKTAAAGAYTETELNEKSIGELMKLAQMVKIPTADYSGRSLPIRAASEASTYTPPDPYAKGITALQSKTVN
ncbi:MAG: zinc finger-like domain-containing protein, partial [Nitrospirales bacterium]